MSKKNKSKDLKVIFAPGSFDNFDGTQEELDQLVEDIKQSVQDGSFFDVATSIDFDDFADGAMVEEDLERLKKWLENVDFIDDHDYQKSDNQRKLH